MGGNELERERERERQGAMESLLGRVLSFEKTSFLF